MARGVGGGEKVTRVAADFCVSEPTVYDKIRYIELHFPFKLPIGKTSGGEKRIPRRLV
jgi:hypothetical protein